METTLGGALLATIYKVPAISLTTRTAGGEHLGGRLLRRTAVIAGPFDFAAVGAGRTGTLARRRVTALTVGASGPYKPEVTIALSELRLQ